MKLILFVALFLFSGCMTTNNGNKELDAEKTCVIIKAGLDIGLPIAIEKFDGSDMIQHTKNVVLVLSETLDFLDKEKSKATIDSLDKLLENLSRKLSPLERHALQGSLNLALLLLKDKLDPKEIIGEKAYFLIRCVLSEAQIIFESYAKPNAKLLGVKPLRCSDCDALKIK